MENLRHFTDEELEDYRRRAVRACAEHEMALRFNQFLDENGIERVSVESWHARLLRRFRRPFGLIPTLSMGSE